MVDLFDRGAEGVEELRRHVTECAECGREYGQMRETLESITPQQTVRASADFKERVMKKAVEAVENAGRSGWFPAWVPKAALVGALAVGLIVLAPWLSSTQKSTSPVMSLLAQSVQAASNLQSVHLITRMRTLPGDNFELIGLDYDFVPIEMWKQFSDPPKWRVEKPGRVVVMDGASTTMLFKTNQAVKGGVNTGMVEWLKPLLDVDQLLERESRTSHSQTSLVEEFGKGGKQLVLTASMKAQGDLTNDWVRNKSVVESDHTRVYRFDALTKRLAGLQVFVHANGRDVLVFEVTEIRYNEPVDPAFFALEIPQDAIWSVSAEQLPAAAGALPGTPKEAATLFFDSLAKEDWQRTLAVYAASDVSPVVKKVYGGLKVNSIGEPFQSGLYPGWFVPYEITLKSGDVKKHKLALRNDNKQKRFVVDGGF
jgi:hypothetical protein